MPCAGRCSSAGAAAAVASCYCKLLQQAPPAYVVDCGAPLSAHQPKRPAIQRVAQVRQQQREVVLPCQAGRRRRRR